jgi:hypothetical protein
MDDMVEDIQGDFQEEFLVEGRDGSHDDLVFFELHLYDHLTLTFYISVKNTHKIE